MTGTAFLFPGQGAQHVGMGLVLSQSYPEAQETFVQADAILGFPLSTLCFEGPAEELTDTINAQPAILTHSVAALRVLENHNGLRPDYVAGHSLGEFSALVAAGALTFEAALRLVRERGRLMKLAGERSPGGMAAILGLPREAVEAACESARQETGGIVQIANDNCPGQIVVSGEVPALEAAMAQAQAAGARKVVRLAVSIAAHSPLMATVADEFAAAVEAAPIQKATIPIVGNVSARRSSGWVRGRAELTAQLTSPVRWTDSMRWLIEQGVKRVIELGPDKVLTGLMKRIDRRVTRINLEESVEGLEVAEGRPTAGP